MKLEWGKKVHCPACALPFYNMQKTSLECPSCGNKFDLSELTVKKGANVVMDEVTDIDDKITLSNFGFPDNDADVDLVDDADDLSDKDVLDDIKLVDEE